MTLINIIICLLSCFEIFSSYIHYQHVGLLWVPRVHTQSNRDRYAAQIMSLETQREVPLVAMPPVLLQVGLSVIFWTSP